MRGFLDSELENFIRGYYKGESLQDVVDDDPDYIKDILNSDEHELTDDEEKAFREALKAYEEE